MSQHVTTGIGFRIESDEKSSGSKYFWIARSRNSNVRLAESTKRFNTYEECRDDIANFYARCNTELTVWIDPT